MKRTDTKGGGKRIAKKSVSPTSWSCTKQPKKPTEHCKIQLLLQLVGVSILAVVETDWPSSASGFKNPPSVANQPRRKEGGCYSVLNSLEFQQCEVQSLWHHKNRSIEKSRRRWEGKGRQEKKTEEEKTKKRERERSCSRGRKGRCNVKCGLKN